MNTIRVSGGITIDVNDYGDTITVPVEDQRFMDKFLNFYEHFRAVADEMGSSETNGMDSQALLQQMIARTTELMADLDGIFGEKCCQKVFGDIVPSTYLMADFLNQLVLILENYMDERQKSIAKKYNGARKGARSVKG